MYVWNQVIKKLRDFKNATLLDLLSSQLNVTIGQVRRMQRRPIENRENYGNPLCIAVSLLR